MDTHDVNRNFCLQRTLKLTVLNDAKSALDRQSVAKLHDKQKDNTIWQTTSKQSDSVFCVESAGAYDIEVSAVGYLTEHKDLLITGAHQNLDLEVVLKKDPSAVSLSAADEAIPAKARKDTKHAVDALKSADLKNAQKRLEKAYQAAPSSAQINFLLGYLFLQRKDLGKAESYLVDAAKLGPPRAQTLTLLGRVQLQREHYEDARKTLEDAVAVTTDDWMAHNLLADVYLRKGEYEKASAQAQLAIDEGKNSAAVAELTLGQSLADQGQDQKALEALRAFLQTSPTNATAPQVRTLIAEIEKRDAEASSRPAEANKRPPGVDLMLAASEPSLPPSSWGPPGIDDVKPSIATGVRCPDDLVERSGERVKQFVDSMAKFSATEDLLHEQLDPIGTPITKEALKFDYVAAISEPRPGALSVEEYRNDRYGIQSLPDHIATTGFVTLALVFHPYLREGFQITCEGLGQWHGQATWLVRFKQRADRPNHLESFVAGSQSYRVDLKGRAWINADNFQIVRIESELVKPVGRFSVQHEIVDYGPVHFQKKNVDLWLPQSADLFLEINRRRYYRRHSFDHFMLFSTSSEDKPGTVRNGASNNTSQTQ
ncbi:MAG: tetratricopeptide repeat protein [Candidatus Sulfotelmatobacter sp.]